MIDRCLESVYQSKGITYEVIVVTSDPTYQTNQARLRWLEDGPAAKRNLGAKVAKADYYAFLDDDVEISPYCLYELHKFMLDNPACGMGFCKIYNMERRKEFDDCGSWLTFTGFLWARAGNNRQDNGQHDNAVKCLAGKSATCIARRPAFQSAGRFDPDYYILGEESDLAWRMWLQRWEVWYIPSAHSWHAFGCQSIKPKEEYYTDERIFYRGCRNYLSMLWANLSTLYLIRTLPCHLFAWLLSAAGFAIRGEGQRSLQIMRALRSFITDLPNLQRKRKGVQSGRLISDRELWPMISHNPGWRYYWNRLKRYLVQGLHG